jgi:hypothetical protein
MHFINLSLLFCNEFCSCTTISLLTRRKSTTGISRAAGLVCARAYGLFTNICRRPNSADSRRPASLFRAYTVHADDLQLWHGEMQYNLAIHTAKMFSPSHFQTRHKTYPLAYLNCILHRVSHGAVLGYRQVMASNRIMSKFFNFFSVKKPIPMN